MTLEDLAYKVKSTSLCALGQSAPNGVLTTLKYFHDEYLAHIEERKCPSHQCTALITYGISEEKCKGCGACMKNCPASAISGKKKSPHAIDTARCIKCGNCITMCKFDAVVVD